MQTQDVPVAFKHMARNINSGMLEYVNSMDDLVAHALIGAGPQEASEVRPFLRALLAKNMPPDALADFWSSMPSGLYFTDGEAVRGFLSALLDRLQTEPYLSGQASIVNC